VISACEHCIHAPHVFLQLSQASLHGVFAKVAGSGRVHLSICIEFWAPVMAAASVRGPQTVSVPCNLVFQFARPNRRSTELNFWLALVSFDGCHQRYIRYGDVWTDVSIGLSSGGTDSQIIKISLLLKDRSF
jgi:hypothetical protein